jgi:S-adenosylmethionine:tRNA ribosyltransferase-isomerase
MRLDFFEYDLPPRLIAQEPCAERDQSRLLVVRRTHQTLEHRAFHELPDLLKPGDLLVLNDTRVLPARLLGHRARTGGKWEGLFLSSHPDGTWELLCHTRGRLVEGETILIEPIRKRGQSPSQGDCPLFRMGTLRLELTGRNAGHWLARPSEPGSAVELLQRYGRVPLPPYIRKGRADAADRDRYQTIYARPAGSVAAPTAGLHFTPRVLERLEQRGIERAFLTLHVGLGTFQLIQTEDVTQHRMHREWGELPARTVEAIALCRARGGRVVAVGTTSVRLLETAALKNGASRGRQPPDLHPWSGETDLFIHPPFRFRVVDALLTNFHLPRSTLLLLVAAFTGVDLTRQAYKTAVEQEYRFFSYGDAMLIV